MSGRPRSTGGGVRGVSPLSGIAAFLQSLRTPSAFKGDAYGWATNQISHAMFVGFGAATLFSFVALKVSDEWIDQRITFAVVVLVYAVIWEVFVQKWRGVDSAWDVAFVALGASAFLVIDMAYVIERIALWYVALVVMLIPGILSRTRDRHE